MIFRIYSDIMTQKGGVEMIDRDLPLKKEIAKNIQRLMNQRGLTQVKLSELSGISKSTLSDYRNCKTLISPGNVEILSDTFGVPKSEIDPSFKPIQDDLTKDDEELYESNFLIELPVYGNISCGNGILAYEDIEGYKEIPSSWISSGEYFFLRAKGDSMINARIEDGDLLLIRQQETFENGEIMAVLVEDEAFLKRIYRTNGSLFLQSENPKYQPIIVKNDSRVKIIGKLKTNFIEY